MVFACLVLCYVPFYCFPFPFGVTGRMYTVKQIRRIYGRITGNQLPVHVPFFFYTGIRKKYLTLPDRIGPDSVTYGSVAI